MTIQCQTLVVSKSCTPNWQCNTPLDGYESDGCGNEQLNINCGIIKGSIIQLNAINLTPAQNIQMYEWKLNDISIPSSDFETIIIDTSNLQYGDNTLSLTTKNYCDTWSDEVQKTINIINVPMCTRNPICKLTIS